MNIKIFAVNISVCWQDNDMEEEEFSVEKMYFHEEFGQGGHLNNDIALIRIKTKSNRGIRFGSHVQPICLPPPSTAYVPGMNCTIAGWGSPGHPGAGFIHITFELN